MQDRKLVPIFGCKPVTSVDRVTISLQHGCQFSVRLSKIAKAAAWGSSPRIQSDKTKANGQCWHIQSHSDYVTYEQHCTTYHAPVLQILQNTVAYIGSMGALVACSPNNKSGGAGPPPPQYFLANDV